MSHPPLIGITGRRKLAAIMGAPAGFADAPLDTYLAEYAQSVVVAGGLPVHLPQDADPEHLIARVDGLIIAGGDDVDPRRYGQAPSGHTTSIDPARDLFEARLLETALDSGTPALGVCRGAQLLNVVRGGTLHQHLPHGEGESHGLMVYPRAHPVHDVSLSPDSLLHDVYGDRIRTNSFHHQAIDVPGEGVVVTAVAADGVVEGIEITGALAVGVQWHPEVLGGDPIFDWLVRASASARMPHATRTSINDQHMSATADQNRSAA